MTIENEFPNSEKDVTVLTEEANSGPAFFANRSVVSLLPSGVRISFLEQQSPTTIGQFRNAVFLSFPDAIGLKNLLDKMLKSIEISVLEALETNKAVENKNV